MSYVKKAQILVLKAYIEDGNESYSDSISLWQNLTIRQFQIAYGTLSVMGKELDHVSLWKSLDI